MYFEKRYKTLQSLTKAYYDTKNMYSESEVGMIDRADVVFASEIHN